ncbi:MAG: hypothetical protein WCG06_00545, partial [Candidatus Omnitrophota bacterium]
VEPVSNDLIKKYEAKGLFLVDPCIGDNTMLRDGRPVFFDAGSFATPQRVIKYSKLSESQQAQLLGQVERGQIPLSDVKKTVRAMEKVQDQAGQALGDGTPPRLAEPPAGQAPGAQIPVSESASALDKSNTAVADALVRDRGVKLGTPGEEFKVFSVKGNDQIVIKLPVDDPAVPGEHAATFQSLMNNPNYQVSTRQVGGIEMFEIYHNGQKIAPATRFMERSDGRIVYVQEKLKPIEAGTRTSEINSVREAYRSEGFGGDFKVDNFMADGEGRVVLNDYGYLRAEGSKEAVLRNEGLIRLRNNGIEDGAIMKLTSRRYELTAELADPALEAAKRPSLEAEFKNVNNDLDKRLSEIQGERGWPPVEQDLKSIHEGQPTNLQLQAAQIKAAAVQSFKHPDASSRVIEPAAGQATGVQEPQTQPQAAKPKPEQGAQILPTLQTERQESMRPASFTQVADGAADKFPGEGSLNPAYKNLIQGATLDAAGTPEARAMSPEQYSQFLANGFKVGHLCSECDKAFASWIFNNPNFSKEEKVALRQAFDMFMASEVGQAAKLKEGLSATGCKILDAFISQRQDEMKSNGEPMLLSTVAGGGSFIQGPVTHDELNVITEMMAKWVEVVKNDPKMLNMVAKVGALMAAEISKSWTGPAGHPGTADQIKADNGNIAALSDLTRAPQVAQSRASLAQTAVPPQAVRAFGQALGELSQTLSTVEYDQAKDQAFGSWSHCQRLAAQVVQNNPELAGQFGGSDKAQKALTVLFTAVLSDAYATKTGGFLDKETALNYLTQQLSSPASAAYLQKLVLAEAVNYVSGHHYYEGTGSAYRTDGAEAIKTLAAMTLPALSAAIGRMIDASDGSENSAAAVRQIVSSPEVREAFAKAGLILSSYTDRPGQEVVNVYQVESQSSVRAGGATFTKLVISKLDHSPENAVDQNMVAYYDPAQGAIVVRSDFGADAAKGIVDAINGNMKLEFVTQGQQDRSAGRAFLVPDSLQKTLYQKQFGDGSAQPDVANARQQMATDHEGVHALAARDPAQMMKLIKNKDFETPSYLYPLVQNGDFSVVVDLGRALDPVDIQTTPYTTKPGDPVQYDQDGLPKVTQLAEGVMSLDKTADGGFQIVFSGKDADQMSRDFGQATTRAAAIKILDGVAGKIAEQNGQEYTPIQTAKDFKERAKLRNAALTLIAGVSADELKTLARDVARDLGIVMSATVAQQTPLQTAAVADLLTATLDNNDPKAAGAAGRTLLAAIKAGNVEAAQALAQALPMMADRPTRAAQFISALVKIAANSDSPEAQKAAMIVLAGFLNTPTIGSETKALVVKSLLTLSLDSANPKTAFAAGQTLMAVIKAGNIEAAQALVASLPMLASRPQSLSQLVNALVNLSAKEVSPAAQKAVMIVLAGCLSSTDVSADTKVQLTKNLLSLTLDNGNLQATSAAGRTLVAAIKAGNADVAQALAEALPMLKDRPIRVRQLIDALDRIAVNPASSAEARSAAGVVLAALVKPESAPAELAPAAVEPVGAALPQLEQPSTTSGVESLIESLPAENRQVIRDLVKAISDSSAPADKKQLQLKAVEGMLAQASSSGNYEALRQFAMAAQTGIAIHQLPQQEQSALLALKASIDTGSISTPEKMAQYSALITAARAATGGNRTGVDALLIKFAAALMVGIQANTADPKASLEAIKSLGVLLTSAAAQNNTELKRVAIEALVGILKTTPENSATARMAFETLRINLSEMTDVPEAGFKAAKAVLMCGDIVYSMDEGSRFNILRTISVFIKTLPAEENNRVTAFMADLSAVATSKTESAGTRAVAVQALAGFTCDVYLYKQAEQAKVIDTLGTLLADAGSPQEVKAAAVQYLTEYLLKHSDFQES